MGDSFSSRVRVITGTLTIRLMFHIWSFLFLHSLFFSALFARNSFHALCLSLSCLFSCRMHISSGASAGGAVSTPVPHLYIVGLSVVFSALSLLANLLLGVVAIVSDDFQQHFLDSSVYYNALSVWNMRTETKRMLLVVALDAFLLLLAIPCFVWMRRNRQPSNGRRHQAPTAAVDFSAPKMLRWAFFFGVGALLYPSYIFAPCLVVGCCVVTSYYIPNTKEWKWKTLFYISQAATCYGTLIVSAMLGWRNPAVGDGNDTMSYLELALGETDSFYEELRENAGELVVRTLQLWAVMMGVITSRAVHGKWSPLQVEDYQEFRAPLRKSKKKRGGCFQKLANWALHIIPLFLVPTIGIVALALPSMVSFTLLCLVCCGMALSLEHFVRTLPYFTVAVFVILVASYCAAVHDNINTIFAEILLLQESFWANVLYFVIQAAASCLAIAAYVLFKANVASDRYFTQKEKRIQIRSALAKLAPQMHSISAQFRQFCKAGECTIRRSEMKNVLESITALPSTASDVDQVWQFFTRGELLTTVSTQDVDNFDENNLEQPLLARNSDVDNNSIVPQHDDSKWILQKKGRESGEEEEMKSFMVSTQMLAQLTNLNFDEEENGNQENEQAQQQEAEAEETSPEEEEEDNETRETEKLETEAPEKVTIPVRSRRNSLFLANSDDDEESEEALDPSFVIIDEGLLAAGTENQVSEITLADFIVMLSTVEYHRMQRSSNFEATIALFTQLLRSHTASLSLLAMFFVATYRNKMDGMHMVYIAVFVVFLCAPSKSHRYWAGIVAYTICFILLEYLFTVVFTRQDPPTSDVYEIVGLVRLSSPFVLAPYFVLLGFAVAEFRIFSEEVNFRSILLEMEWRSLSSSPVTRAMQLRVAVVVTAMCFVLVGLIEPRSALVAGFLSIFLSLLFVGSASKKLQNFLWGFSTVYSVIAFVGVSLYQFEYVHEVTNDWIKNIAETCEKDVQRCASQLGLWSAQDSSRPLVLILFPWFVACTSNLIQTRMRLKQGNEEEAAAEFSMCEVTSKPLQVAVSILDSFGGAKTQILEMVAAHSEKLVFASQFYASVSDFNVLHGLFQLLYVFNHRGRTSLMVSMLSMAVLYIYPFFFFPKLTFNDNGDTARFWGLVHGEQQTDAEAIFAPVLVFAANVIYESTKPGREERHTEQDNLLYAIDMQFDERPQLHPCANKMMQPLSIGMQVLQFLYYLRYDIWIDFGYELLMLFVLISISISVSRISAVFLFIILVLLAISGRLRLVTMKAWSRAIKLLSIVVLMCLYTLRIGFPKSIVDSAPLYRPNCNNWWDYLGCSTPVKDFFFFAAVVWWMRVMRQQTYDIKMRATIIDGCTTLGDWLSRHALEVALCRATAKQGAMKTLLPKPSFDLRSPKTIVQMCISAVVFLFPTSVLVFFHGVLVSSALGVCEVMLGLVLLSYKREIAWKFYKFWNQVCGFLLFLVFVQLLSHVPAVFDYAKDNPNVASSVGFLPWSSPLVSTFAITVQLLLTWAAFVQKRVFNEFFFTSELNALFNRTVKSVARHCETMAHLEKIEKEQKEQAAEKERGLRAKLEMLHEARKQKMAVIVDQTVEDEEEEGGREVVDNNNPASSPSPEGTVLSSEGDERSSRKRRTTVVKKRPVSSSFAVGLPPQFQWETLDPTTMLLPPPPPGIGSSDLFPPPPFVAPDAQHAYAAMLQPQSPIAFEQTQQFNSMMATETGDATLVSPKSPVPLKPSQSPGMTPRRGSLSGEGGGKGATPRTSRSVMKSLYSKLVGAMDSTVDTYIAVVESVIEYLSGHTYSGRPPANSFSLTHRLFLAFVQFCIRRSSLVCYMACALNFAASGTLLDCLLSASTVMFALIYHPWPPEKYWSLMLTSTVIGILLKSMLKVVAEQVSLSQSLYNSVNWMILDLGKTQHTSVASAAFSDILFDFLVFGALLVHLQLCNDYGAYGAERKHVARRAKNHDGGCLEVTKKWTLETYNAASKKLNIFVRNAQTRIGSGTDMFSIYLLIDAASLVYFLAYYYNLAGQASGSFVESVQQDLLPGPLVALMLFAALTMVLDRIVYVLDSIKLKLWLHLFLCLLYHIIFIWWRFSMAGQNTFTGGFLFLMKMLYLTASCRQIRLGFPLHRQHDPFTRSPDTLHWLGHVIYRGFPFLFELRLLLDWTFSRTALKVQAWILLEDLHNEVYMRYVDMEDWAWTNPFRGRSFPKVVKLYTGVLGFIGIMVILFFPLMYYSTFNPNMRPNSISSLTMSASFSSVSTFYSGAAVDSEPMPSSYPERITRVRPTLGQLGFSRVDRSVQLLSVPQCSATLWPITPGARNVLLGMINNSFNNESSLHLHIELYMTREGASGDSETEMYVREKYTVPYGELAGVHAAVNNSDSNYYNVWIPLPRLYSPFVFNRPNSIVLASNEAKNKIGDGQPVKNNMIDCRIALSKSNPVGATGGSIEYWCLECEALFTSGNQLSSSDSTLFPEWQCATGRKSCENFNFEKDSSPPREFVMPYFVAVSDRVPTDSNFLPNIGIIALYTTFILTLGTVIRGAVTGNAHRVVMKQMADPAPIAEMLSFIYLSRSSIAITGADEEATDNLKLEEQLYFELLDMLRSPERILQLTGLRVEDYDSHGRFHQRHSSLNPF